VKETQIEQTQNSNSGNVMQAVPQLDIELMELDKTEAAKDQISLFACGRLVFTVKQMVRVLETGRPTMADIMKLEARLAEVKRMHKASSNIGGGKELVRAIESGEVSLMELY